MELPAKLPDDFLWSHKSNINQPIHVKIYAYNFALWESLMFWIIQTLSMLRQIFYQNDCFFDNCLVALVKTNFFKRFSIEIAQRNNICSLVNGSQVEPK